MTTPVSRRTPRRFVSVMSLIVAPGPRRMTPSTRPGPGVFVSVGGETLRAPDDAVEDRQPDAIVGQGADAVRLGVGQRHLGIRQVQDRADAGIVAALGQAKVLLRGLDRLLGRGEP